MDNQQQRSFLSGQAMSIRTFIGAKDFYQSRKFYQELGFTESMISDDMSYFSIRNFGFYLQQYFVKDWVDNSMIFFEVEDADATYEHLKSLELQDRFTRVRLSTVKEESWGKECFLHDPSGVLWHFGQFYY
ncbi:MAG: glyoxalase [Cytophagales bacterium]|nr:glyoxalase [Cytophagales bacterium]